MESKPKAVKVIRAERIELVDKSGRTHAVLGAEHGTPYALHYDGKGRILRWLTFLVDGALDIRSFGNRRK
jgi:hypothetical protein